MGNTSNIGDSGAELGGINAFVNLGAGRTASKIATGLQHACALLDNSTVKCWGDNAYGQIGNAASPTDARSPVLVSFSGGKTPDNIWAFGFNTCAHFTDNTAVCWGYNLHGEAGNGTTTSPVNAPPSTMLSFGSSRHPTKMVGSNSATCALLNDSTIQCWGDDNQSTAGQLGYAGAGDKTSPSGTGINLGVGRTAVDIAGGISSMTTATTEGHFCAALDDGTVKCWGRNSSGQIGDGTTTVRNVPTATTSIGFNVVKIFASFRETCAMSSINNVRCWGRNTEGQLLIGSTTGKTSANTALCISTLNMAGGLPAGTTASLTMTSTTNCTANGRILIDSELICYTTVTSGTVLSTLTRGCAGTAAAAHANGATVTGLTTFGDTFAVGTPSSSNYSTFSLGGRSGCVISGGGAADNDRIKCWGYNLNAAASAQSGLLLYHSTVTGATVSYIGDTTAEIGLGLPFVNH